MNGLHKLLRVLLMIVLLVILQVNLQDRFGEVMIQNLRVRRTPLNACLADVTFVNSPLAIW